MRLIRGWIDKMLRHYLHLPLICLIFQIQYLYSSQSIISSAADTAPLNLLSHNEWTFKSNGRCPCYDQQNIEGKSHWADHGDGEYQGVRSRDLRIGMTCEISRNISTTFFEQFSTIHQSLVTTNFDPQAMYFTFKLQLALERHWLHEYESFIDFIMQRVQGQRLPFAIHIQIEDMFDHWPFFFDKVLSRDKGGDKHVNDKANENEKTVFEFAYNIGWDVNFQPNSIKRLVIEAAFDNVKHAIHILTQTYNDDYTKELTRRFQNLHRRFELKVQHLSLSYIQVPDKLDLFSDTMVDIRRRMFQHAQIKEETRDPCLLLGSSCAAVLKRITYSVGKFPNISTSTIMGIDGTARTSIEEKEKVPDLPRVLCSIFTHKPNHATKVTASRDTWGRKCTAFIAFSTVEDLTIPSIDLPHLGEEIYQNMWQKTRSIIKYVRKHYMNEFDWFLFGGDDMHIVMENLYEYLSSPEIVNAQSKGNGMYLGRTIAASGILPDALEEPVTYNSGGAGYILDPVALTVLAHNLDFDICHAFHGSPNEDALVGNCLAKSGIFPYNSTHDNLGRRRFHLFYLGFEYEYLSLPEELRSMHWYQNYDQDIRSGDDCCSDQSISAQYLTDFWMYSMDDFIYRCPNQRKEDFYRDKPEGFFDRRGYNIVIPKE